MGTIEGVDTPALAAGWQIVINDTTDDDPNWRRLKIGMVTNPEPGDANPLSGEGPLLFVRFIIPTELRFVQSSLGLDLMFNEGDPPLTASGGAFTVARYGDASGNDVVSALDATWMLWDTVELIDLSVPGRIPLPGGAPGDSIDILEFADRLADVSGRVGVTSYDAGLTLLRLVGLLPRFPVEEGMMRINKPTYMERTLQLVDLGDVAALVIDEMGDVLAGDVELSFDPSRTRILGVEKAELTDAYLLASNVTEGKIRISFAGAVPPEGPGEIVRIRFDGTEAIPRLEDVRLNEGMIPVRYLSAETASQTPRAYRLAQNYPNPFNPETNISFDLPEQNAVKLWVYNTAGQRIRTLMDGGRLAGAYTVAWDGKDDLGRDVSTGVYFYRLKAGDFLETRKMLLVR